MNPWPHQMYAIDQTLAAIAEGKRRICVTSPTGGGKTLILSELARHFIDDGKKVVLYTNRKMLVQQTTKVMTAAGITHGVRASGYADNRELLFQVSSIQTENARSVKMKKCVFCDGSGMDMDSSCSFCGGIGKVSPPWRLHDAPLVCIDEAHLQKGMVARQILKEHHDNGAAYVGLTATPIGIGDLYDHLIVAGTNSELRKCGALVKCIHYGPDEPDLKHIGRVELGEDLTDKQNIKAIMTPTIFGRVWEWWNKLNAEQRPTLLFAPGVAESLWFAEQFHANGVSSAHIDGQDVWINGEYHKSCRQVRDDLFADIASGTIKILCNRFVCREGIDVPAIEHMILATVFGSLQSCIQSVGRGLRACNKTGKTQLVIQDHGGNWHRHGSMNIDRSWDLSYTGGIIAGLREERLRAKQDKEPCRCPKCGLILSCPRCPCGFEVMGGKRSRPVIQSDGSLKEMSGDIYRPRRISNNPDAAKIWERMYHRAKSKKWDATFRQAEAMFAQENNWGYPSRQMPLMPKNDLDFFRKVSEVPMENLRGRIEHASKQG